MKINNKMKNYIYCLPFTWLALLAVSCAENTSAPNYETTVVRKNNLSSSILATGIIKPKIGAEVRVGSSVSGIVRNIYVKNGDLVRKGDLLAKLDDSELSARYRLEVANLDNYQTILKYAKIDLDRSKILVDKEFTSVQSYDNSLKEYEIARARVASQKAAVDFASTELGFTKIYAPISGVIGSVSTQEGETVMSAFTSPTFVTIIDLDRIEVWTYVDETDIGKVETGQEASFTVDTYSGTNFKGRVSAIYPKAEIRDNVVNYIVIVEISGKDGKILRPEMTASVTILTNPPNLVLSVPSKAIKQENLETMVYLLKNGKPLKQPIKTGLKGNQLTEVTQGLNENDLIITNIDELTNN
jgi:RND family efflux transporter MFP subunit